MLDTRQYDRSITDLYWNTDYIHAISNDAGRSMMGPLQENWFYNQLIESKKRGATWRVIGSQTVFSRINESVAYGNINPLDYDAWYVFCCKKRLPMLTVAVQGRLYGKP
jgi:alkaline phosphatase D